MEINPSKITIEIGTPCNLSCEMCFLSGFKRKEIGDAKKSGSFMPPDLFKKIVDQTLETSELKPKNSPFAFILTGGEPFLHPSIFEMIEYAEKKGINITIFTNGTLINSDISDKIVRKNLGALMFSLDGPEKIHDEVRGAGNFSKTRDAIQIINRKKMLLKKEKPYIFVNSLINTLNAGHLDEFVSICNEFRINGLSFSHIQWSNPDLSNKALAELHDRLNWKEPLSQMISSMEHGLKVKESQIEQLLSQINKIKSNYRNKSFFQLNFLPDLSDDEIRLWYSSKIHKINCCDSYQNWIRIGFNGDVYPVCAMIPLSLGNLNDQTLKEILDGDRARTFIDEIKNNGFFYACHRCCRRPDQSRYILAN